MNNNDRTLIEAELDLVSGGLRDRPWVDYLNRQNRLDGSGFGASIANVSPGLVIKGDPPGSPGHPL